MFMLFRLPMVVLEYKPYIATDTLYSVHRLIRTRQGTNIFFKLANVQNQEHL